MAIWKFGLTYKLLLALCNAQHGLSFDLNYYILQDMKNRVILQERGQITLPKRVRKQLRLQPGASIEVQVIPGGLLLKKPAAKLKLDRWVGYLKDSFKEMGFETAEQYIAAIRRGQR